MRLIFITLLATFSLVSCSTTRKVTSTEKTIKESKITSEKSSDSSHIEKISEPHEGEIILNVQDLIDSGNFKQKIKTGDGTESSIEKIGDKIIIRNKNRGSRETTTKVKESDKSTEYNSEYVYKEMKTLIERVPLRFKLLLILLLLIIFRKLVFQILGTFFPVLRTKSIFQTFTGLKKK